MTAHRLVQLERMLRRIRGVMLTRDDDYEDKCGELVLTIQRRCRSTWADRHNARVESLLDRQG